MPKPTPAEGSEENPFTTMNGTEETKQELPDASDDSDAFDPRVLDGTLEEDATYGDRTLPGGLKAPRATSLALRLAMRCAEGTEARRKAKRLEKRKQQQADKPSKTNSSAGDDLSGVTAPVALVMNQAGVPIPGPG